MGNCIEQCFPSVKGHRFKRLFRTKYDGDSMVEFESLMESDYDFRTLPKSISSLLSFRNRKCHQLIAYHTVVYFYCENTEDEELLELEEQVWQETRQEAASLSFQYASTPAQIINPAKLAVCTKPRLCFTNNGHMLLPTKDDDDEVFIRNGSSDHLSRTRLKSFASNTGSCADTCSTHSREKTNGSSPPSSIDLEWEHEEGIEMINPKITYNSLTDEEENNGGISERGSTPASNELEWDPVFVNTELATLDFETEQLISEIEQLTSEALKDNQFEIR